MLRHIVLIRARADVPDSDIEAVMAAIRALRNTIADVRLMEVARDENGGERSATFGLVSHFDDMAALERYRVHPVHQEVLARLRAMAEWIKAWDYTIPPDSDLQ